MVAFVLIEPIRLSKAEYIIDGGCQFQQLAIISKTGEIHEERWSSLTGSCITFDPSGIPGVHLLGLRRVIRYPFNTYLITISSIFKQL